jgi:alanine dehydrogenase
MIIGVPREIVVKGGAEEKRVSLSPVAASDLKDSGIEVVVEQGAGEGAHFSDEEYRLAGATVVYSKREAYQRADIVVKVQTLLEEEWGHLRENQVLMGFLFLGISPKPLLATILEKHILSIGMELVLSEDGTHPLQRSMSKIAGNMAPQIAGRLLQSNLRGGRGLLLGGIEGVPPAEVVILGAGTLGTYAARSFAGLGASVYVVDKNMRQLERVAQETRGRAVTLPYNQRNLARLVKFADVLICAVQLPGEQTPQLVSREMVRSMKRGSVIMDFSVDQGGVVETIRLTPNEDHVYLEEGVIHFAVPNVPSWVARTASHVLSNVILPYLQAFGKDGVLGALAALPEVRAGVCTCQGFITNPQLHLPGGEFRALQSLLSVEGHHGLDE